MIKVLILVDHAVGTSGPHRNVVGSLNALSARADVDLRLLTGRVDETESYSRNCDVRLGFNPHNPGSLFHNLSLISQAIKDRDLVYVPSGLKAFLYAFVSKRGCKLVAGPNVTGIPILMDPANPSPLMTMRMSDAWIENSEIRSKQCVIAGTPRSHIHLVPHSVDTGRFSPKYRNRSIWEKFNLDPEILKIIHVGRMNMELKGIEQLIQSFQLLQEYFPEREMQLILVGKKGSMLKNHHKKLRGLHTLGPKYGMELVELLSSSDIFMGASRYESFWFTPLEAMACGLPVVVSTAGAVPTMIPTNGAQGYTVNIVNEQDHFLPDAAHRLAEATRILIDNPQLRHQIGRSAREYVDENFSEQKLGRNLVDVFESALDVND